MDRWMDGCWSVPADSLTLVLSSGPAWRLVTHTASGCRPGVVPIWRQASSTCHFLFLSLSLSFSRQLIKLWGLSSFFFRVTDWRLLRATHQVSQGAACVCLCVWGSYWWISFSGSCVLNFELTECCWEFKESELNMLHVVQTHSLRQQSKQFSQRKEWVCQSSWSSTLYMRLANQLDCWCLPDLQGQKCH